MSVGLLNAVEVADVASVAAAALEFGWFAVAVESVAIDVAEDVVVAPVVVLVVAPQFAE